MTLSNYGAGRNHSRVEIDSISIENDIKQWLDCRVPTIVLEAKAKVEWPFITTSFLCIVAIQFFSLHA